MGIYGHKFDSYKLDEYSKEELAQRKKACNLAISNLKKAIDTVCKREKINKSDLGIKLGYKTTDLSESDDQIEIGKYDIDEFLSKNKVPENISKNDPMLIDIVNNKYWKYVDAIIEEAKRLSKQEIEIVGEWRTGSIELNL